MVYTVHCIVYIPLKLYYIYIVQVPVYGGVLLCTLYTVHIYHLNSIIFILFRGLHTEVYKSNSSLDLDHEIDIMVREEE